MRKILEAAKVAANAHSEQKRKYNGEPYINHPFTVASIILDEFYLKASDDIMEDIVIAALLHDVMEDGDQKVKDNTYDGIYAKFGQKIAEIVDILTKKYDNHDHDDEYYERIRKCGRPEAWIIKTADRIHNISRMDEWTDLDKRKKYLEETKKYVLPIAKLAGDKPYTRLLEELAKYAS